MIKIKEKIIYFISILLMAVLCCGFFTIKYKVSAENNDFFLSFEELEVGAQSGEGWQFYIYDGEQSGVAENPTDNTQKSLKISSNPNGNGGIDWLANTVSFQDFKKEVNVFSADFYFPSSENCDEKDCIYVQVIRDSNNRFQPFAVYPDCIQAYSTDKTGKTYKTGLSRNEWFTVSVMYYPQIYKYDVVYEKDGVREVIAKDVAVSDTWNGNGFANARIMSRFEVKDGVRYAYVDNVTAYAFNQAPILYDLDIIGLNNNLIGETITAEYSYTSDILNQVVDEEYQWYRSDKPFGGTPEKIIGATSKTYATTKADLDKYLSFTVQVTDEDGYQSKIYTSRSCLVYDNKYVRDFEEEALEEDSIDYFYIDKTDNISAKVNQDDFGKYLEIKGENGDQNAHISIESNYNYGFKNSVSVFEFDIKLSDKIRDKDFISMFLLSKSQGGESAFRSLIIEANTLYIGDSEKISLPLGQWVSVKIIILSDCTFFIELSTIADGTIFNSQPVLVASTGFRSKYDEVGLSNVRIYYEVQNSYLATPISLDNFKTYQTEGFVSIGNIELGTLTVGEEINYEIPYISVGNVENIVFQPTAGSVPSGIKIEEGKIIGKLKKVGEFSFTVTAFYANGNKALATISGEVLNAYTIEFITNGGNSLNSISVKENSKLSELESPERKGYLFVGWYKDSTYTEKWMADETVQSNIVLYAKWSEKEYMVTFYDAYGKIIESKIYKYKEIVELPTAETIGGYTFSGWYLDEGFTQPWQEGDSQPSNMMKLYGKWVQNRIEPESTGCSSNISGQSLGFIVLILGVAVTDIIRRRK